MKKNKSALPYIIFVFILFIMPKSVFAGCFAAYKPIIDQANIPKCVKITANSCEDGVRIFNQCEAPIELQSLSECELNVEDPSTQSDLAPARDYVKNMVSVDTVVLPHLWDLHFLTPTFERYNKGLDEKTRKIKFFYNIIYIKDLPRRPLFELLCNSRQITSSRFELIIRMNNETYGVAGHYRQIDTSAYDDYPWKDMAPAIALVMVFGLLLIFWVIRILKKTVIGKQK
jgi:hypothetical protein